MPSRHTPAWVRRTQQTAERSETASHYHSALIAGASAVAASIVTGLITLLGMQVQVSAQQNQLETQIEEDRESARIDERMKAYARFLARSDAITAQMEEFDYVLLTTDLEGGVEQTITTIRDTGDEIRNEIYKLGQLRTRLMVIGPTSLPFVAWDIVDDQRHILQMKQLIAISDALKSEPRDFAGFEDKSLDQVSELKKSLRQMEVRLTQDTSNLIVGVLGETGAMDSANPEFLATFIDQLNERRADQ